MITNIFRAASCSNPRSKMSSYNQPSKWRLWHPNQGVVFAPKQQPLYPVLDISRFISGVSAMQDSQPNTAVPEGVGASSFMTGASPESASTNQTPITVTDSNAPAAEEQEAAKAEAQTENAESPEAEPPRERGVPSGPPYTPLDFQVPDEIFRKASMAPPGSPESFWSYALYRGPGDNGATDSKVKIHYCKSQSTTERVLQYFLNEKVIGLDLEWSSEAHKNSGPRRNVSLIQIASQSRIALFHLALFPKRDELATPTLRKIIEDPSITKCGVWIKGDCTRLRNHLNVNARSIFELSHLYKQVKHSEAGEHKLINKRLVSLATQTQEILKLPMFKGQDVRASEWSAPLSMDQIVCKFYPLNIKHQEYEGLIIIFPDSASDAYAAVHLYAALNHQRECLNPTPPLPYHAELDRPIPLADGAVIPTNDETEADLEAKSEDRDTIALPQEYLQVAKKSIQVEDASELWPVINAKSLQVHPDDPMLLAATAWLSPKENPSNRTWREIRREDVSESIRPLTKAQSMPYPNDPRLLAAHAWIVQRQKKVKRAERKCPSSYMRAYHLWYFSDMKPLEIARFLRNPPLKTSTAENYIVQAIRYELLAYDMDRLKTEFSSLLPIHKKFYTLAARRKNS